MLHKCNPWADDLQSTSHWEMALFSGPVRMFKTLLKNHWRCYFFYHSEANECSFDKAMRSVCQQPSRLHQRYIKSSWSSLTLCFGGFDDVWTIIGKESEEKQGREWEGKKERLTKTSLDCTHVITLCFSQITKKSKLLFLPNTCEIIKRVLLTLTHWKLSIYVS